MPDARPAANPTRLRNPVPKRLSSQTPPKPGNTITIAAAMILETQVIASEMGEGSFEEEFTGDIPAVKSVPLSAYSLARK
jgi:hypothetical protein